MGGPRVRTLLALLALQPGRVIGCDTLICGIWGDTWPADPANALQTLVKRVRVLLPANAAVESAAGGYRLRIESDDIDLHRFTRLIAVGIEQLASGAHARAAETLDVALALWHGSPFTDLADNVDLYWHADRVNQVRLEAIEARADAYLAIGRSRDLLDSLSWELRHDPLRESLAARLIHALTASGRPAQAREVFATTRNHLNNELGVGPSSELQAAAEQIGAIARVDRKVQQAGDFGAVRPSETSARAAGGAATGVDGGVVPARLTRLIGREPELRRLGAMLDGSRLLTLTGAGGCREDESCLRGGEPAGGSVGGRVPPDRVGGGRGCENRCRAYSCGTRVGGGVRAGVSGASAGWAGQWAGAAASRQL
ncbi:AfsR/SARP family transcriptional regulator [Nocardia heshunensis]